MAKKVKANGKTFTFDDDVTNEQIGSVVDEYFSSLKKKQSTVESATTSQPSDLGGMTDLSGIATAKAKTTTIPSPIVDRKEEDLSQPKGLQEATQAYRQAKGEKAFSVIQNIDQIKEEQKAKNKVGGAGDSFMAGVVGLNKALYKTPRFVYDLAAVPQNFAAEMLNKPELQANYNEVLEANGYQSPLSVIDRLGDIAAGQEDKYNARVKKYDDDIVGSLSKGNFADAGAQVVNNIAGSIPSMMLMAATGGAGNAAKIGYYSKTLLNALPFASGKMQELSEDPTIPEYIKPITASLNGLAEVIFDQKFGTQAAIDNIVKIFKQSGKEAADVAAKEFTEGYINKALKQLGIAGKSISKGALEEVTTTFAQNITDKYTINPDKNLMDGVADAAIVGGLTTGGVEIGGKMLAGRYNKNQKKELTTLAQQRSDIIDDLDKDNVSEEVKNTLKDALDVVEAKIEGITEDAEAEIDIMPSQVQGVVTEKQREIESLSNQLQDENISPITKQVITDKIKTLEAEVNNIIDNANKPQQPEVESEIYKLEKRYNELAEIANAQDRRVGQPKTKEEEEITIVLDKLNKLRQDAVQIETAGQVPVLTEARVGEEVEQGKPQPEVEGVTKEGGKEEVVAETPKKQGVSREVTDLDIAKSNLNFAEIAKKEATEYLKRYKNNPFADKVSFNKAKLADANKKIKKLNQDISKLSEVKPAEVEKKPILYVYNGEKVISEEDLVTKQGVKYKRLTFENGKNLLIKEKEYAALEKQKESTTEAPQQTVEQLRAQEQVENAEIERQYQEDLKKVQFGDDAAWKKLIDIRDAKLAETYDRYNKPITDAIREAKKEGVVEAPQVEVSKLQTAKDRMAAAKAKLKGTKLGIAQDSEQKAKDLFEYHSAIVDVAKEYIKEGITDAKQFAKEIGEKLTKGVQEAWDEASAKEGITPKTLESFTPKKKAVVTEPIVEKPKPAESSNFIKKLSDDISSADVSESMSNIVEFSNREVNQSQLEYNAVKNEAAIKHGRDIIEVAKEEFGDNYVNDVLNYVDSNIMPNDVKALTLISLENDLHKRLLEEPQNEVKLSKQLKKVENATIKHLRESARGAQYGIFRRISRVGYDVDQVTDTMFSKEQSKAKENIKKKVEEVTPKDIQKQAEEREQSNEGDIVDLETLVEKSKSTKEKKKAAIDKFNSEFNNFFNAIGKKSVQSTIIPYAKQLADAAPHILGMAKALKEIGGLTATEIATQIHIKIKPYIDGISETDISDIISKKGVMSPELKRKLYIKQLEKQITELDQQIEDGKRKIVNKEDKYKNDEEINTLRNIREDRKNKLAEIDPEYAERRKLETDLKNAQKSLDDWQNKLDNNEFTPAEKKSQNVNEKLQKLRDKRDSVRDKFKESKAAYEKSLVTPEMIAEKEVSAKLDANKKAIDNLRDKLDNDDLSTNTKQTSLWTAEIGKLEQEKSNLQKELNERRKATKKAKEAKKPATPEELLQKAKDNIKERIAEKEKNIADKEVELKVRGKKFTEDAEYKSLKRELSELAKLEQQYLTPESKVLLDERKKNIIVTKLENEIADLDKQITSEQKTAVEKKQPLTNDKIEGLKADKKVRVELLEQIDPNTKDFIKQSLIDDGYSKEITVTRNGVKEKRSILDWNKLSTDGISTIRDVVEKALAKNTDLSDAKKNLMISQLENEYVSLQADIIEKGINDLNRGNEVQDNTSTKTLATRIAEMYNKGLFNNNPDTYDYLVNKTFGTTIKEQELFFKIKDLARTLSLANDFKTGENRLSDIAKSTLSQQVKEQIKDLIQLAVARQSATEGLAGKAFLASEIIKQLMGSSQRQLLVSLKQLVENPISNYINDLDVKLQDLLRKEKWDNKELSQARSLLSKTVYNDTLVYGGTEYGGTGNAFVSKNAIEDWISSLNKSEIYQVAINIASGKPFLDSADSAFKIKRTELEFTHNLLRILTDKSNKNRMTQDEALAYVSENLTGQSLTDATKIASELIDHVNSTIGRQVVSNRETNIKRIANDIMKDGLVNGGRLTIEEVRAAFDAAYVTAGSGIGHEANNIVSRGVSLLNKELQAKLDKAVKEKQWGVAAMWNAILVLQRNFLTPFVGGGTNWTMIGLQRIGVPTQYFNPNSYGNKAIDLSTKEGMNELSDNLERKATLQRSNGRTLIGLAAQLSLLATAGVIFSSDDEDKEKIMKWMKDHPEITKYSKVVTPFSLQMYFSKDDDMSLKNILSTIGSRYGYKDDATKLIDASKGLYQGWSNDDAYKTNKGASAFGEYLGGKMNLPYAPTRFYKNVADLAKELKGKKSPYIKPSGFISGFSKNGLGDILGFKDAGGSADILLSLNNKSLELIKAKDYELKSKDWGDMKTIDPKLGIERVATKPERDIWNKEYNEFMSDYLNNESEYLQTLSEENLKEKLSQIKQYANSYSKYKSTKYVGNIFEYTEDGIIKKTNKEQQDKIMALYDRRVNKDLRILSQKARNFSKERDISLSLAEKITRVSIMSSTLETAKKTVLKLY